MSIKKVFLYTLAIIMAINIAPLLVTIIFSIFIMLISLFIE